MATDQQNRLWPSIVVSGIGLIVTFMFTMLGASWSIQDRFVSARDYQSLIDEVHRNEGIIAGLGKDKADASDVQRNDGLITSILKNKADSGDLQRLIAATVQQHVSSLQREEFERWLKDYNVTLTLLNERIARLEQQKASMGQINAQVSGLNSRLERVERALDANGKK
jgi:hypothetical protein